MLALVLSLVSAAAAGTAPLGTANITISASAPGRAIPASLFGSNVKWDAAGEGLLELTDGTARWNQPLLSLIANSGITALRFPGGSLANLYDWRAGVGPASSRPPAKNWVGEFEPSWFGTTELVALATWADLDATITVNISSTPEDAADWVEYLNGGPTTTMGAQRAAHGFRTPLGVRHWEIGNEIYNPFEPGHTDALTYSERFLAFHRAIKARDSSAKVGAVLEGAFLTAPWVYAIYPDLATWNDQVLSQIGRTADFFIVHLYGPFDLKGLAGDEEEKRLAWAAPDVLAGNLLTVIDKIRAYRSDVEVVVTEYGELIDPENGALPDRIASTEGAIFNGLLLMKLMSIPNVTVANQWSLVNNHVFGMMTTAGGQVSTRPSYDLFDALARSAGGRWLPVTGTSDTYAVEARGNVPAKAGIPYIQGVAVRRPDGALNAVFINRSPETPVAAAIRVAGGPWKQFRVRHHVPAPDTQSWIAAPSRTLRPGPDGALHAELPPQSFTILESIY